MKTCSKCGIAKELDQFNWSLKAKGWLRGECKKCNIDIVNAYIKKNKNAVKKQRSKHYQKNRERLIKIAAEYNLNHKEEKAQYMSEYFKIHAKEKIKYNNEYEYNRKKIDPAFKLGLLLRKRLHKALKNDQKIGSAIRDLGCTVKELKAYLESKFYNNPETGETMTWEKWSPRGWHVDHIRPLSSFDLTDREQFLKAANYTNLQPLWAEENLRKGAKYDSKNN